MRGYNSLITRDFFKYTSQTELLKDVPVITGQDEYLSIGRAVAAVDIPMNR